MPTPINPVAGALAHALTNDRYGRGGVVSANDADRIVDAAIEDIATSETPQADFTYNARFIDAAKLALGRSDRAADLLDSYGAKGMNAVNARLAALGQDLELPANAKSAVAEFIGWRVDAADVTLTNESELGADHFSFDWAHDGDSGSAFALKFEGVWVVSPVEVGRATLQAALEAAHDHFDTSVTSWASNYNTPDELAGYRAEITIVGMRVTRDPDDPDKTDDGWEAGFPYEFEVSGGTPGDGSLYVGFKPNTGDLNGFGRWA